MEEVSITFLGGESFEVTVGKRESVEKLKERIRSLRDEQARLELIGEDGESLPNGELVLPLLPSRRATAVVHLASVAFSPHADAELGNERATVTKIKQTEALVKCGPVLHRGTWVCKMRVDHEPGETFADSIGIFSRKSSPSLDCVRPTAGAIFLRLYGVPVQGADGVKFSLGVYTATQSEDLVGHPPLTQGTVVTMRAELAPSCVCISFEWGDSGYRTQVKDMDMDPAGFRFGAFIYNVGHGFTVMDISTEDGLYDPVDDDE